MDVMRCFLIEPSMYIIEFPNLNLEYRSSRPKKLIFDKLIRNRLFFNIVISHIIRSPMTNSDPESFINNSYLDETSLLERGCRSIFPSTERKEDVQCACSMN